MNGWTTPTVVAVAALLCAALLVIALGVALARSRRRTDALLAESRAVQQELAARLEALEGPAPLTRAPDRVAEFVITDVGAPAAEPEPPARRIEGRLFADIVLRESVVKAASWTYGVTRALSAENRNRLGFEMRRETKRSQKQRRADVKEALRQYYERQRGDVA